MGMSLKTGSPFIFINDSGGARVQEGIDSLAGYPADGQHGESYFRSIEEAALNEETIAAYERHLAQLKAESSGRTRIHRNI